MSTPINRLEDREMSGKESNAIGSVTEDPITSERHVALAFLAGDDGSRWRFVPETKEVLYWGEDGWAPRHDLREHVGALAEERMVTVGKNGNVRPHPWRGKNSTAAGAATIFKHLDGVYEPHERWNQGDLLGLPGRNVIRLDQGTDLDEEDPVDLVRSRLGALPVRKPREGNAWDRFLKENVKSTGERQVLKLALALALIGRPSQHAILLAGPRRTGKSTLQEALEFVFGSYTARVAADAVWNPRVGSPTAFKVDTAVAALDGKRIGIVSDAPDHKGLSNVFRALTGDSSIPARRGNTFFDVLRTFAIVAVCNRLPKRLSGSDRRRIILIQMEEEYGPGKKKVDPAMKAKLIADAPDFIAELLALIPKVTDPKFDILNHIPASTHEIIDRAQYEEGPSGELEAFMTARVVREAGCMITLAELHAGYQKWYASVTHRVRAAPLVHLNGMRGALLEAGYLCGKPRPKDGSPRVVAVLGVRWRE